MLGEVAPHRSHQFPGQGTGPLPAVLHVLGREPQVEPAPEGDEVSVDAHGEKSAAPHRPRDQESDHQRLPEVYRAERRLNAGVRLHLGQAIQSPAENPAGGDPDRRRERAAVRPGDQPVQRHPKPLPVPRGVLGCCRFRGQ